MEDYLGNVLTGFASNLQLNQLSEDEYSSLVRSYRQNGLEALAGDQRHRLLLVAQAAFLSYAETVRYIVRSQDASPSALSAKDGFAVSEEIYVRHTLSSDESPSAGLTFLELAAFHASARGIEWFRGYPPRWNAEAPDGLWVFVDFLSYDKQLQLPAVLVTAWADKDGGWSCLRTDPASSYQYYVDEVGRIEAFAAFARGTVLGSDTLDGRPAYEFEGAALGKQHVTYWLDAETLWLRQYEYEEDGIRYTVKLEAVNEDITIEPPDVDVPCVGETPSGEETPAP